MKILVIGAGPAGLAFAARMANADLIAYEIHGCSSEQRAGHHARLGRHRARPCAHVPRARRATRAADAPRPCRCGIAAISSSILPQIAVGLPRDVLAHRVDSARSWKIGASTGVRMRSSTDGSTLGDSEIAAYDLVVAADGARQC